MTKFGGGGRGMMKIPTLPEKCFFRTVHLYVGNLYEEKALVPDS